MTLIGISNVPSDNQGTLDSKIMTTASLIAKAIPNQGINFAKRPKVKLLDDVIWNSFNILKNLNSLKALNHSVFGIMGKIREKSAGATAIKSMIPSLLVR